MLKYFKPWKKIIEQNMLFENVNHALELESGTWNYWQKNYKTQEKRQNMLHENVNHSLELERGTWNKW